MKYLLACQTDVGSVKQTNQDSLLIKRAICNEEQLVLAVVCDGMGGLQKGEVASASLVREFSRWFEEELPEILKQADVETGILLSWDSLLKEMNERISAYGKQHEIQLGTTVTAIIFVNNEYFVAHVGDSRAYELGEQMFQITRDQTLVAREVEQGLLTEEEAEQDSRRSVLLQCIGASEQIVPAYIKGNVHKDAVYLLCCDGFRHVISSQEIYEHFRPEEMVDEDILEERCRELIRLNMERGEQDNISVIAIRTW